MNKSSLLFRGVEATLIKLLINLVTTAMGGPVSTIHDVQDGLDRSFGLIIVDQSLELCIIEDGMFLSQQTSPVLSLS